VAKGKPRGNPKKLKPIKKGTHPVGRKPGTPNKISRTAQAVENGQWPGLRD
jgi:hypothetical protein